MTYHSARHGSGLAAAGVDRIGKLGVAGCDRPQFAGLGVAGVNTRPLQEVARLGVAGNMGRALRSEVERAPLVGKGGLGDRAAKVAWQRVLLFPEWTYWVCPTGSGGFRFRKGFEGYAPENRSDTTWVDVDSGGFRRFMNRTPAWDSELNYYSALPVIRPRRAMVYDTLHDQVATHESYRRMLSLGLGDVTEIVPIWQVLTTWNWTAPALVTVDPALERVIIGSQGAALARLEPKTRAAVEEQLRLGIANALLAMKDERLRGYLECHHTVGFGGLAKAGISRWARVGYLLALILFNPDNVIWGLAQASPEVINGISRARKLKNCVLDGTTWILMAMCDEFLIRMDGELRRLSLKGVAQSFFTNVEKMTAILRAMAMQYEDEDDLGAAAPPINWPPPAPIPTDKRDLEGLREVRDRIKREVAEAEAIPLSRVLAAGDPEEEEAVA